MLYHLFEWFKEQNIKFPGSGILDFISFRVLLAMLLSLIITLVFGKRLINVIKRRLGDETVRDLGLAGEQQKKGTPTMGGVIIILGIVVPTLLFARLDTIYIIVMLIATVWLGIIGFMRCLVLLIMNSIQRFIFGRFLLVSILHSFQYIFLFSGHVNMPFNISRYSPNFVKNFMKKIMN